LLVSFTGFLSLGSGRHWGGTRPPPPWPLLALPERGNNEKRPETQGCRCLPALAGRAGALLGGKHNGDVVGDELEGRRIRGSVVEPLVELGRRLGLRGELDELPRERAVGRPFEHAPRARAAHRAVPHELDRHPRLLQLGRASVPNRHHVELAVADELLRLVTLPP